MDARAIIHRRYSCRSYLERPLSPADHEALTTCLAARRCGPLGSATRFALIAAEPGDASALRRLGTYGFIKGATGYIVGAVHKGPRDLEDYGYVLEEIVLRATELGLGTCWLGGTFTRGSFTSRFGGVGRHESVPAVVSLGYPGDDGGVARIHEREHGSRRLPPGDLFFEGDWGVPLERLGSYAAALHAVRMAPSATNRQPWRIVRRGDDWHFCLSRYRWYGPRSPLFLALRIADLQRVDLGIAMCHFELVARECGEHGRWEVTEPGLSLPGPGTEYVITWRAGG